MAKVYRVKRVEDGAMGWLQDHVIHPDHEVRMGYMAVWRSFSKEDQEDFKAPPAAYVTASGMWEPA